MPEPRDPVAAATIPATTVAPAVLRAVAARLGAVAPPPTGRPPVGPTWPAWPIATTGPSRWSDGVAAGTVAAGPVPPDLARPAPTRSDLAAGTPLLAATEAPPDDIPASPPGAGAIDRRPTTAIPAASVPPPTPAVPAVAGSLPPTGTPVETPTDPIMPDRAPLAVVAGDDDGGAPAIAPGTMPGFAASAPVGDRDGFVPTPGEGRPVAGTPVVRGRPPAAPTGMGAGYPPPGMIAGSPFGRDEVRFGDPDGTSALGGAADGPGFSSLAVGAGAGSDGTNSDLARTNQLLEQILDVIGKQRGGGDSSLPSAGPSVYADRS